MQQDTTCDCKNGMQLKQAVSLDGCAVFLMDSAAELASRPCRASDATILASHAWITPKFNGPGRLVFLFGRRTKASSAKQSKAAHRPEAVALFGVSVRL